MAAPSAPSASSPATEKPVQQWPSPWPYDFPAAGKVPTAPDKVARVSGAEVGAGAAPLTLTRRNLFSAALLGWSAFLGANAVGAFGALRFLFPTVNFEPPTEFATAELGTFSPETVNESWKESNAVWIVNTGGRLVAISTVCTHLGCTPNWLAGESKFKCPCHGSGYYINGVNFEGPTPRPLERFRVYVNPADGKVWVDKTMKCQVEKNECDRPDFSLATA
jgi:cytochrome b6-f complex iron-sulfur subunit